MKGTELALIFDVGTQATRALVFDTKGEPVLIVKQPGKLYISDADQRAEEGGEETAAQAEQEVTKGEE